MFYLEQATAMLLCQTHNMCAETLQSTYATIEEIGIYIYIEDSYITKPIILLGRRDKKYLQNLIGNPSTLRFSG